MSEIADAFRRIEHPNVRTNTSVQPFNCALRSFAQACHQRMKQQLYWVKVRRILRQVAQACTDSLGRLFHNSYLVEGDLVDHHNVPALERWDQTLLYVSQEGLSIHGSFDQHRSHDAGLTQPSDKRHRLPVSHRGIADQALAAWVPTVEPQHVGGDCRLVDNTRWAGSRKPCSRIQRRRARATSARFRSAACRLFFNGDAMASKKSGKRAAAAWDSPLVKRRNDLIQREVRYLADEGEDLPRVLLQWRSTPSTGHGFESPVFTKALHPPDRRTDADIKLFSRLPSGSSFLHEVDDARSQLTRIRFMHWPALRRINALDSHLRRVLGIPIHCGRDVL